MTLLDHAPTDLAPVRRLESEVRSYVRSFPTVFTKAVGPHLFDARGRRYIDFFAGAGALNYGHNEPHLKAALLEYLTADGVTHSLDMATAARIRFLETFERRVLLPRDLPYKVMLPGPTGTNAVEAAVKLARKVTGRPTVLAFTNAFHGMTLGSLALTGNASKRAGAGVPLHHVARMPFAGYLGEGDTIDHLERLLGDPSSGVDVPAAFILETVQAEGGVNVASDPWLKRLAAFARRIGALLIVDDIQVGCGRTGPFFSFEPAGLRPDIVCLSKSLSGYGLPFSAVLMRSELDQWSPGEHNGTFRGFNPACVTAAAALDRFWSDGALTADVQRRAALAAGRFEAMGARHGCPVRGRGLIRGLVTGPARASAISRAAFERGLIIETAGPEGEVVKLLPPLTIDDGVLAEGLDRLEAAVDAVFDRPPAEAPREMPEVTARIAARVGA